jgi:DNA-binding LytR/AlgR family response regulator
MLINSLSDMHPNKKRSCIIVDNDAINVEILKKHIQMLPYLELIHAYCDPVTAIREILSSRSTIDFLFMDITLPDLSGLEVAAMIRHKVDKLIFTTADTKYSLAAYDVLCNQYVLKPITVQKFSEVINRLINQPNQECKAIYDRIFIKSASTGKYVQVKTDDIVYINALEHYVVINTLSEQHIQHTSMKDVEYALRGNPNLIRVHKSYIISKNHISSVSGNTIVLTNNVEIVIGATFKQSFTDFLNTNLLVGQ